MRSIRHIALPALLALLVAASGCVFRIDIQQGNVLEEEAVDQVEVGMSRSAVQFLLGTPMIADSFHRERWDYPYYLKRGRSDDIEQRWLIVHFEGDQVARLERDVPLRPAG
jgi:outer membrane protein assembly factor BamE